MKGVGPGYRKGLSKVPIMGLDYERVEMNPRLSGFKLK
jgi:hypothetical protein